MILVPSYCKSGVLQSLNICSLSFGRSTAYSCGCHYTYHYFIYTFEYWIFITFRLWLAVGPWTQKKDCLQIFKCLFFWLYGFCREWEGFVNHTSWVVVVTPTDRPKSVRNRWKIKHFVDVFVLSLRFFIFCCYLGFFFLNSSNFFIFLLRWNKELISAAADYNSGSRNSYFLIIFIWLNLWIHWIELYDLSCSYMFQSCSILLWSQISVTSFVYPPNRVNISVEREKGGYLTQSYDKSGEKRPQ